MKKYLILFLLAFLTTTAQAKAPSKIVEITKEMLAKEDWSSYFQNFEDVKKWVDLAKMWVEYEDFQKEVDPLGKNHLQLIDYVSQKDPKNWDSHYRSLYIMNKADNIAKCKPLQNLLLTVCQKATTAEEKIFDYAVAKKYKRSSISDESLKEKLKMDSVQTLADIKAYLILAEKGVDIAKDGHAIESYKKLQKAQKYLSLLK